MEIRKTTKLHCHSHYARLSDINITRQFFFIYDKLMVHQVNGTTSVTVAVTCVINQYCPTRVSNNCPNCLSPGQVS